MKRLGRRALGFVLLIAHSFPSVSVYSQTTSPWPGYYQFVEQGFDAKLYLGNWGFIGREVDLKGVGNALTFQYPSFSEFEHIDQSSVWVGAIVDSGFPGSLSHVKRVSSSEFGSLLVGRPDSSFSEFRPVNPGAPAVHRSKLIPGDSGAVSESDWIFEYADTFHLPPTQYNHLPIGVKVLQRSYAWAKAVRAPIFPIEFDFVNVGPNSITDAYLGLSVNTFLGPPSAQKFLYQNSISGYWPELRTAFVENPIDFGKGATPIGFSITHLPVQISNLTYRFRWFDSYREVSYESCDPCFDRALYDYLSGARYPTEPAIRPNQSESQPAVVLLLFSFGPIPSWAIGETLKVAMAILGGSSLEYGSDNIHENARLAQTLAARNWHPQAVLPSPTLRVETQEKKTILRWGSSASTNDQTDFWDDENAIASFYPPDHWRRSNPPAGHTRGGRIFEGYRLYRSEDPGGAPKSFALLKQWDMADSIGPVYEFESGIETTYVDSPLATGKTYWYSVTSFGIPDLHIIDYLDFDGSVKKETLNTRGAESSLLASRKRVHLPFSVSRKVGEVKVVPNPYRDDENYTYESGGWEGRANAWNENKRVIKFIHLPATCTLRIYSLVGEVVTTIHHDDPVNGEEQWNLLSESNRAIASGIYIFSVESNLGNQVGKFVVTR